MLSGDSVPTRPTFLAIDGEGTNREDGTQAYTLLCTSSGQFLELYSDRGLATHNIFRFLLDLGGNSRSVLCGFFIGYDVTKWVSDLSDAHKSALWEAGWVVWKHAGVPYLIEWLPNKVFSLSIVSARLSAKARHSRRNVKPPSLKHPRIKIYDVGGFFQCSFVKALEEWGVASKEECAEISEMKGLRNDFASLVSGDDAAIGRARIRAYCLSECRSLVRLMDTLAATLWATEIYVKRWHGAGAVAATLFSTYAIKSKLPPQPEHVQEAIMGAYFGGHTELYRQGLIEEPLYVYDINSAYPTALVDVPDLRDAHWEWRDEYDPNERFALWKVAWDVSESGTSFGPLPYRRDGRMYYPYLGTSWVHASELVAARRIMGSAYFSISGGWVLRRMGTAEGAFGFVADLAAARLRYKQDGDPRHRVLKLGLNSLYGKLAQKQKQADRVPPFQNYYLAGYVTAHCRSRLLPALLSCGDGLSMVATDGIFTTRQIPIDEGPALGQWEVKGPYEQLLLLQSGVLFTPESLSEPLQLRRTRGFRKTTLDYDTLLREWFHAGHEGSVHYSERRFLGLGAGYSQHDMSQAGRWIDSERDLTFRLFPTKVPHSQDEGRRDSIRLIPNDAWLELSGPPDTWRPSDAYQPGYLSNGEAARLLAEAELAYHDFLSQPDWSEQR